MAPLMGFGLFWKSSFARWLDEKPLSPTAAKEKALRAWWHAEIWNGVGILAGALGIALASDRSFGALATLGLASLVLAAGSFVRASVCYADALDARRHYQRGNDAT
jgi:hypothetical protein